MYGITDNDVEVCVITSNMSWNEKIKIIDALRDIQEFYHDGKSIVSKILSEDENLIYNFRGSMQMIKQSFAFIAGEYGDYNLSKFWGLI